MLLVSRLALISALCELILVWAPDPVSPLYWPPPRVARPVLSDVTPWVEAAREVGPGEQGLDGGPGLLHQLYLHSYFLSFLSCNLLESGKQLLPGEGVTNPTTS